MRDDLEMLQTMIDAGWTPSYDDRDKPRIKKNETPQHSISFAKGKIHIWSCYDGWQVAELIDGRYRNHRAGNSVVKKEDDTYDYLGNRRDRYTNGFIPDLKTILELEKAGDL